MNYSALLMSNGRCWLLPNINFIKQVGILVLSKDVTVVGVVNQNLETGNMEVSEQPDNQVSTSTVDVDARLFTGK